MARVAPSATISPPISQVGQHEFLDRVKTYVPRRETQLKIKISVTSILLACATTAGILEVNDLHARTTATARALHDPTCWLHIYPYDEDDVEVRFEVAYRVAEEYEEATEEEEEEEELFSIDSKRVLDVQLGNVNRLISNECTLLVMRREGGFVFHRATTSTDPMNSTEPVMFGTCRSKVGGGDVAFEQIIFDERITRTSGIATLGLWMLLRILYLCREVHCQKFETTHPITTRTQQGCCVPWPLHSLLEKMTGGGRLLLWNVYYVIVRPYITYSIMSSSLLKVISSIHLNDDCPQLVMQTGHHVVAVVALVIASIVVSCSLLQWAFDAYRMCYKRSPAWKDRFREWGPGQEHATGQQRIITDAQCVLVLAYWITSAAVNFPVSFIVELRFLFSFSWPSYAISRWAHMLRISVFLLWISDTASACLKFLVENDRLEEARKKKAQGCSAEELKKSGFSAEELREIGFSAVELKSAPFSVGELKEVGFDAVELKEAFFSTVELMAAGFSALELKEAGFSAAQLKETGFSAAQLREASFSFEELQKADFSFVELKEASFSAVELKKAGFTAMELKNAGFSAVDVMEVGFTAMELKNACFSAAEVELMKEAGFSAAVLKEAGFTAMELKNAGFSAVEVREVGFCLSELKEAGFSAVNLKENGFSALDLMEARFSAVELQEAGFSAAVLKEAYFSAAVLKEVGFSAVELKEAGFSAEELKQASFDALELKLAGFFPAELREAGFSAVELQKAGFSRAEELKRSGFSAVELNKAGFSAEVLLNSLFLRDGHYLRRDREMFCHTRQMEEAGFSVAELMEAGFSAVDLKNASVYPIYLREAGFSAVELKEAGFSDLELKEAGFFVM